LKFSHRTDWHRQQNRITELLQKLRSGGKTILDLTNSNPTKCGILYPREEILSALSQPTTLNYDPDPRGLLSARTAIARYYTQQGASVEPSEIFLCAGTSEAYSHLFKLLCNPGDDILVPQPSYPLFEYLAELNDVQLRTYRLLYDHGWQIDMRSIEQAITLRTKALVVVNPHNPTGMILKRPEYEQIRQFALKHRLAIISDEVFNEYAFHPNGSMVRTLARENEVLTFTLNGISKLLGLPQLKLGWIILRGNERVEAAERLEILCDTFLSVGTPVQTALPLLLPSATSTRTQILQRVKSNYAFAASNTSGSITLLECDGGWYAVLRVPSTRTDEEWALGLLEQKGVYLFPGYFFDFDKEGMLVVSLLVEESDFQSGYTAAVEYIDASTR